MGTTIINGSVIINGNIYGGNVYGGTQNTVKGDGISTQEERELPQPFDQVDVSAFGKVEITAGQKESGLSLSGDSNILKHVETSVEDGTLFIKPEDGYNLNPQLPLKAKLFMGDLTGISASASSAVEAARVSARHFSAKASSSASISVSGKADSVDAKGSSSAQIDLTDLRTKDAEAKASSSAQVRLHASDTLSAKASSSGMIIYSGSPTMLKEKTSSSGMIISR